MIRNPSPSKPFQSSKPLEVWPSRKTPAGSKLAPLALRVKAK